MTEQSSEKPESKPEAKFKLPFNWKRLVGFVGDIINLDRKIKALTEKSEQQDATINRMQRTIDEQSGQIKQLGTFVQTALHDRIDSRAEKAAMNLLNNLISFQDAPSPPAPPKLPRAKQSKPKQP